MNVVTDIRRRLAEQQSETRAETLALALRDWLAPLLQRDPAELGIDSPLSAWELEEVRVLGALRRVSREQFGLGVYMNEVRPLPTLRAVASYLLGETGLGERRFPLGREGRWVWESPGVAPGTQPAPPMLFVLSAPRSGSTLLRVMLAGHPALYSPPELCLLPHSTMRQRERELNRHGYGFMGLGLLQTLTDLTGSAERAERRLATWIARDLPTSEVYRRLQEMAAGRMLVDKSPLYTASRSWLERAEGIVEGARYLYLHRHPGAVVESFVRMRFERLLGPVWGTWDDDPARFAELTWARWNRNILEFLERVPSERHCRLSYEELVREPEPRMRAVCGFLGLPFESAMLEPYSGERMTFDPVRATVTIGDPNLLTHREIDGGQVEKWRDSLREFAAGSEAREIAARLGYHWPVSG